VLWVNNTDGYSLTPLSPKTGKPGRPVPVADPYNLYFTPDGNTALVMAEARARIDFRNPHTMRLRYSMPVPSAGVNHLDFTADGRYAVASCEFSAKLLWIDIAARTVVKTLTLGKAMSAPMAAPGPGYAMPQDVRLSADGTIFYVADMAANGIWLINAHTFTVIRFLHTGAGAHGFLVSRERQIPLHLQPRRGLHLRARLRHQQAGAQMADPGRRLAGHGRDLPRREGDVVERPLQRRGVCDVHRHRAAARQNSRRGRTARSVCVPATGPVLTRPHRQLPLAPLPC
jgi:hypothetical protein